MIVPATPFHAPALAAIHAVCFGGRQAWGATDLLDLLNGPGVSGLVDTAGGFLLLRRAVDEADVLTLAVVPAIRRCGLGTALLEAGLAGLRSAGVTRVFLEVAIDNQPAAALYTRLGFVPVAGRASYYPGGGSAMLMRRRLDPP